MLQNVVELFCTFLQASVSGSAPRLFWGASLTFPSLAVRARAALSCQCFGLMAPELDRRSWASASRGGSVGRHRQGPTLLRDVGGRHPLPPIIGELAFLLAEGAWRTWQSGVLLAFLI